MKSPAGSHHKGNYTEPSQRNPKEEKGTYLYWVILGGLVLILVVELVKAFVLLIGLL